MTPNQREGLAARRIGAAVASVLDAFGDVCLSAMERQTGVENLRDLVALATVPEEEILRHDLPVRDWIVVANRQLSVDQRASLLARLDGQRYIFGGAASLLRSTEVLQEA